MEPPPTQQPALLLLGMGVEAPAACCGHGLGTGRARASRCHAPGRCALSPVIKGFARSSSWRYLRCSVRFEPLVFRCPAFRGHRHRPREARAGHRAGTRSTSHFSRCGRAGCAIVAGSVSSGTRGGPRGRGARPGEKGGGTIPLHGRAAHDIAHPPTPGPAVRHRAHGSAAQSRCRSRQCGPR